MDMVSTSASSRLQTLRRCISVAFQQARQSEIEEPSKRRFRLLYEAGDAPAAHLRDSSPGKRDLVTRAGVGIKTFWSCYSEGIRQAKLVENDFLERKHYRKLYGAGDLYSPVSWERIPRTQSNADGKGLPVTITTQTHSGLQEFQRG